MLNSGPPIIRILMLTVSCLYSAAPAGAQDGTQIGIGYAINGPEQLAGISMHALSDGWGGTGLYLDAKWDWDSLVDDRTFTKAIDFQSARDEFQDALLLEELQWTSFNLAVMRPISSELVGYVGAGRSTLRAYGEFFDPEGSRGVGGFYWVEDPGRRGAHLNLLGGLFFQIAPRVSIHLGLESAPRGLTVGGSYLFRVRQPAAAS